MSSSSTLAPQTRRPDGPFWLRLVVPLLALVIGGLLCEAVLSLLLHRSLLPAGLSAAIYGMPLYTRLIADTLPTREPHLDVSYTVDFDRQGDLIEHGWVEPFEPSGDGVQQVRLRSDGFGFRALAHHERCDVVILGDSITESAHLAESEPFPLRLDAASSATICNVSIAAVGTLQQRDYLPRFVLPRRPRDVVLAYFEGNDPWDNVSFAELRERLGREPRWRTLLRRRAIPRLGRTLWRKLRPANAAGEPPRAPSDPAFNPQRFELGRRRVTLAFHPGYTQRLTIPAAEWRTSPEWTLTRDLLVEMDRQVRDAGARFHILYLPSKSHVYLEWILAAAAADPGPLARFCSADAHDVIERLGANADAQRDTLRELCAKHGIGWIDGSAAWRDLAREGGKPFLTYDTHPTGEGHRVLADLLRKWLAALGSL